jgi:hypothetical protein
MNPVDACHDHLHRGAGAKTRAMPCAFILPFCRSCRFDGGVRQHHRLPLEVSFSMFITPHPQNGTNGKNGKTAGVKRGVVTGRGTGPGAGDAAAVSHPPNKAHFPLFWSIGDVQEKTCERNRHTI